MKAVIFAILYLALALGWCMMTGAVAIAGCAVTVGIAGWHALPACGLIACLAGILAFDALEFIHDFVEG